MVQRFAWMALAGLVLLAGCRAKPEHRVIVLGLDGLDPRAVELLISEGDLPNFERLRAEGAYGTLRSEEPILSPILWTTIATGRPPIDHGITDFVAVDPSTGARLPVTSRLRRVPALWNLASSADRRVAVVGWWATWPPEAVNGSMVSDHTAYHFLFPEGLSGGSGENRTHPPELMARLEKDLVRPWDLSAGELAPFVDVDDRELDEPFRFDDQLAHFRWALAAAQSYRDIGLRLWREESPDLLMVYIEATDSTSHLFGHLFRAEELGGELARQQARYGDAVEQMYRFADDLVGRYLSELDERTTLIVLSDHGFDLGALHDDPRQAVDLHRVSERFHSLDGVVFLYGAGIEPGKWVEGASILDVTPTVLALLGLPASEEMPGRVLEEALTDVAIPPRITSWAATASSPPADGEIETSDSAKRDPPEADHPIDDPIVDDAIMQHLEALGYLDRLDPPGSPEADVDGPVASLRSDRVLAALHFRAGRYLEALTIYRRLVEAEPRDIGLRASLAGALGALGRYDEAMAEIELALDREPSSAEALHNRAVIHERRGELEEALRDYRSALRYAPDYRPAKAALERLTGTSRLFRAHSADEQRAMTLLDRASIAARSGRFSEAHSLLDQAQELAPELVLIYQYRANVAYLTGDYAAARVALHRALELEPENALFRRNLERLDSTTPPPRE